MNTPPESQRLQSHGMHVPPERRASYLQPGSAHTPAEAQARRRKAALDAQKQHRSHAFEVARALHGEIDSIMALSMAEGSEDDEDENDNEQVTPIVAAEPSQSQSAQLKDVDMATPGQGGKQSKKSSCNGKQQTVRWNKKPKVKYQPWAKNLLTQGEVLDLASTLPHGLETDFCLKVYPRGKRCLCATGSSATGNNTILYSRLSGRTLARRRTALPPDCILDCVYEEDLSVLWVLDIVKWSAQGWLVQYDTDFRTFFLASRLSELGSQPFYSTSTGATPLVVVPCPVLNSPLTPSILCPFLESLADPTTRKMSVNVSISTHVDPLTGALVSQSVSLQLEPTGLLLYHRQSQYESGLTALVGWIPFAVEEERKTIEGVDRFKQLVLEWQARGGEAEAVMES
ncbi:hypothetical protein OIV83_004965 [Microbotryomycetes sp. JL201]|nr:hypothetical protein OIV83_004965 [Microbotryomycetes sp. JL201]